MRLGIKGKQVLGVTSLVGVVVVALSVLNLARLTRVSLAESKARAELLANAVYHRARNVVESGDPYTALRSDAGLRSILESSAYSKNVVYTTIVDTRGIIVVHSDRSSEGQRLPVGGDLNALVARTSLSQLQAIYTDQGRTLELVQPLLLGNTRFGSIRVGVSMLLVRADLVEALQPAVAAALAALGIAIVVAVLLAQLLLRPIHVLRSGLTRLGQGELGVTLDLKQQDEFGDLGSFFNTVSKRLSADLAQLADEKANLESTVERLSAGEYLNRVQSTLDDSRKVTAQLEHLTTGLAHEVKNPLNSMRIHLELLRQRARAWSGTGSAAPSSPGRDADSLQHLDTIAADIRRLDLAVDRFDKFVRPGELSLQPVHPEALVREILPTVESEAARTGVKVDVQSAAHVPVMNADPGKLREAFLNLAINACQAMPKGGVLRISCAAARDGRVEIVFADTGEGIAPEHLERIYDLYFTTKKGGSGSGIGLSMVFRIVQMHGGEIDVQSTRGAGTTFRLRLPPAEGAGGTARDRGDSRQPPAVGRQ